MKMLAWRTSDRASSVGGGMKMAVQRVFCVFCVSPFSYAWCVAYWRMMCGFCSDSNAASYLPADACARTSHARTSHARAGESGSIGALRMPALRMPALRMPAARTETPKNTIGVRCQKARGRRRPKTRLGKMSKDAGESGSVCLSSF